MTTRLKLTFFSVRATLAFSMDKNRVKSWRYDTPTHVLLFWPNMDNINDFNQLDIV